MVFIACKTYSTVQSSAVQYTQCTRMGGHEDNFVFTTVTPTYDTFLESLGPWECSRGVSRIFGHH